MPGTDPERLFQTEAVQAAPVFWKEGSARSVRSPISPINAIVLTGKTWYPELGARHMRRDACHADAPRDTIVCPAGWTSENLERLRT